MSVFILFDKSMNQKCKVKLIHYNPSELPSEMLSSGVVLESIPEPELIEGKTPVEYYDNDLNQLYYEYVDNGQPSKDDFNKLKEQLQTQEQAIAELTMMLTTPTN